MANNRIQIRTYHRPDSAVFLKTKERFGGLSNMAGGFPLLVNNVRIRTSEALYQACRFPHLPHIQRQIIEQKSPMTAKMKGKPHRHNSRKDWNAVRIKIMRWCLEVKLAQNWEKFGAALLETGDLPIVEHSRRDDFWGAIPMDNDTLVGVNALGRLLMELRENLKADTGTRLQTVEPINIVDLLLYERQIARIISPSIDIATLSAELQPRVSVGSGGSSSNEFTKEKSEIHSTYQIPLIAGNDAFHRKFENRTDENLQSIIHRLINILLESSPKILDKSDIEKLMDAEYCRRELGFKISCDAILSAQRLGRQVGKRYRFKYGKHLYANEFYLRCEWRSKHHRHNAERFSDFLGGLITNNRNHPALEALQELKESFHRFAR